MKKILLTLLALGTLATFVQAEEAKPKKMTKMFQTVPAGKATILQEGNAKMFCPECGMTLPMFYKTNHAATVDGKVKQYCSIHCIVEDTQKGSKLTDIKVVDVTTLKFIDADKATYVVGSGKKGTMTMVSKYAFANKADAEAFAKANGGKVVDYNGAYKAAESDFAKDSKMVAKKQAMMAQKGEMMYGKMCQKTDKKFATTAEAKAFIVENKLCKDINPKQMQAIGLYLKSR
ncbi:MAG: nitrous oxide reductase accessory protein NosL [Campylobacterota bacterium]|nr:nitrous oxide reductase accessory protein NosL [Campylobacterota bacterium]